MNCEVVTMVKHDKSEPLVDVTYCESLSNQEKNTLCCCICCCDCYLETGFAKKNVYGFNDDGGTMRI